MAGNQIYFLSLLLLLTGAPLVLHWMRARITLGPFFGLAGVYSILLWQFLQTGWWVGMGRFNFNAGLAAFIPAILMGGLLTSAFDGLRTARSYLAMVLTACLAAWLFSLFREGLAQFVPLPYLVVLSSREHFAIIAGLLVGQLLGMSAYVAIGNRGLLFGLPASLLLGVSVWLWVYSWINFGSAMGMQNVLNEQGAFLIATAPGALALTIYGGLAAHQGLLMPQRSLLKLLSFWRPSRADGAEADQDLTNRDRVMTEVRLLNRAQETSNRLMEYHLLHASYGIVITDADGRIRRHNEAAAKLLNESGLIGHFMPGIVNRLTGGEVSWRDIVGGGKGRRWSTLDPGGGARWLELIATPLNEGESMRAVTGYYLMIHDVTEVARAESRRLASSRIRDLNEAGKVLTHDFSNILIGAEAQLRRLDGHLQDQESIDALRGVSCALGHAREMLKQLGSTSHLGTPRLRVERVDDLVRQAVEICRGAATEAGVKINLPESAESWFVEADSSQMIRVLTNLLRNALRACDCGGMIAIAMRRKGSGITVEFSDNGRGMSDAELEMAFDPGFSTKGEGKGGLGLAISYLMVDAHGGHLELRRNASGPGVCASIWLPEHVSGMALDEFSEKNVIVASTLTDQVELLLNDLEARLNCYVAEAHNVDEVMALLGEPGMHWDLLLVDRAMDHAGMHEAAVSARLEVRVIDDWN